MQFVPVAVIIGILSSGCYTTTPLSPSDARSMLDKGEGISFALDDGTRVTFWQGRMQEGVLRGHVASCSGPSCTQIRLHKAAPLARVSELRGEKFSPALTSLAAIAGTAGVAVFVAGIVAIAQTKNWGGWGSSSSWRW